MTPSDDKKLDALFGEVRSDPVEPSSDIMARVLADAAAMQPVAAAQSVAKNPLGSRILSAIGGWPALSGVAAAGVAGLWIGLVPPDAVDVWMAEALGQSTEVSLIDEFSILDEGWVDG